MFIVISAFSILLNESGVIFGEKMNIYELLLLSSVLCATDTVAVLNIVKEQ
jgi:NhaP-type Na+/H+ or K+/H+ antiporter